MKTIIIAVAIVAAGWFASPNFDVNFSLSMSSGNTYDVEYESEPEFARYI